MISWRMTITTNAESVTFGATYGNPLAAYINPVWLAEMRPGGGPHPRLHAALFRRMAQRTTRRHQRRPR